MADGGGNKWKVIESEMDRFEKEINSLAEFRQPNFIPAQIRRPGIPPPPPPMMAGAVISRHPTPAIISGAPKVYSSEPTITKTLATPAQPPTIRPTISKPTLFPSVVSSSGGQQQPPQQQQNSHTIPDSIPIPPPLNSSAGSSSSADTLSKSSTSTDNAGNEKKKKNKKGKDDGKPKKLVRCAGGQTWEDISLQDWDPSDFRLFCGDLGNDVTDEVLTRVFGRYPSFQKAKVIRDKRTNKTKGYGFVSFKEPNDFVRAIRELDGRYVGSRPIKLRKSNWRNRNIDQARKRERERNSLIGIKKPGKR